MKMMFVFPQTAGGSEIDVSCDTKVGLETTPSPKKF